MMCRDDIIGGLQFTAGMVTFNPLDGEAIAPEDLNEQDKLTYDACMGAIDLLKAQEPQTAYWIPCNGKSHIWYCSHCGEKINYNNAHNVYNKEAKPVEQVNRYCRGCGYKMTPQPTGA
ncbi:MAG: hypothetical protein IKH57_25690 [Clostridia bacterium]|nr:hypothetical protein [Clostridia bacterium]